MTKDLLSLSLTDIPFNNNESVATSEIINMLVQTGGDFEYNNTTNLIIGIALLAIGGIIAIGENNWTTINANIEYLNCNLTNCTLGVDYQVNGITYKKDFTIDLDYLNYSSKQITITYDLSDPSNSYLGTSNYNTIMFALFGVSIFFLGLWYYLSTKEKSLSSSFTPSLSIFTKTETPTGLYTVSDK